MSLLRDVPKFDLNTAEAELGDFRAWLSSNSNFSETAVSKKLKSYFILPPLMGMYGSNGYPKRAKFEFALVGVFRADYVAGIPSKKEFVLVEFESGEANSIFNSSKTNQMRNWGSPLQRGFSQISDWSWAKNDSQKSSIFQSAFECPEFQETYVLICGRKHDLIDTEPSRLFWRHQKTTISGSKVLFQTYDDLAEFFESCLDIFRSIKN